jgi:hypothetical protein
LIALWRAAAVSAALAGAAAGCSQPPETLADSGVRDAPINEPTTLETAQCTATIQNHPDEGALHIACTSPATYLTVPPSSGNHYPTWPAADTYDAPIPWGHLVHFMEHGGVVIAYNCGAAGCADEVARAQTLVAAVADAACSPARVILVPDPTLDVRWAAAAWTWTLRAPCFDAAAFSQFVVDHLGRAAETVCSGYTLAELCPPPI